MPTAAAGASAAGSTAAAVTAASSPLAGARTASAASDAGGSAALRPVLLLLQPHWGLHHFLVDVDGAISTAPVHAYYVRPVTRLDAPADKGPKFVDHGGRYSILLRRLRELIFVTLRRGNAAFIRKWLDICVPKGAAAQGDPDAGGAGAAALEGA